MIRIGAALLLGATLLAAPAAADSGTQEADRLGWQTGGGPVALGSVARFKLPDGVRFLGSADTGKFLVMNGNPTSDDDYTVARRDYSWFAIYHFDSVGKVDDHDKIDADALMTQLKQGDAAQNDERARLKMTPLHLVGWAVPPHYDPTTHNLEWGTRLVDGNGRTTVNYTIRMLGRSGVMKAILV